MVMTTQPLSPDKPPRAHESIVWIDHERAVIVSPEVDASDSVQLLERRSDESEATFEARAINVVLDDDRVLVTGPAFARTSFERAFVAVTHRPDRLLEVEPQQA
jgi:hypothetical protein